MLDKAEVWAKEQKGKTVDDFLLSVIYGEQEAGWEMTMRDRLVAAKMDRSADNATPCPPLGGRLSCSEKMALIQTKRAVH
jgi:hypothetical protein